MPPVAEGGQAAKRGRGGGGRGTQPGSPHLVQLLPRTQGKEGAIISRERRPQAWEESRGPAGRAGLPRAPFMLSDPGTNTQSMLDGQTERQMCGWMNNS